MQEGRGGKFNIAKKQNESKKNNENIKRSGRKKKLGERKTTSEFNVLTSPWISSVHTKLIWNCSKQMFDCYIIIISDVTRFVIVKIPPNFLFDSAHRDRCVILVMSILCSVYPKIFQMYP